MSPLVHEATASNEGTESRVSQWNGQKRTPEGPLLLSRPAALLEDKRHRADVVRGVPVGVRVTGSEDEPVGFRRSGFRNLDLEGAGRGGGG